MSLSARAKALRGVGFNALLRVVHGLLDATGLFTPAADRPRLGSKNILTSGTYGGRIQLNILNRRYHDKTRNGSTALTGLALEQELKLARQRAGQDKTTSSLDIF